MGRYPYYLVWAVRSFPAKADSLALCRAGPLLLAFAIEVHTYRLKIGKYPASGTLESHAGVANVMVGPAPKHPHDHSTGQQEQNSRQAKRLDV